MAIAKICPMTKETVLYLECLECSRRVECKNPTENINISPAYMQGGKKKYQIIGGKEDET